MALNAGSLNGTTTNPGSVRKASDFASGQYSAAGSGASQTIKSKTALVKTIVISGTAADATIAFADAGGTFLRCNLAAAGTIVVPWAGKANGSLSVTCAATTTVSVAYD